MENHMEKERKELGQTLWNEARHSRQDEMALSHLAR